MKLSDITFRSKVNALGAVQVFAAVLIVAALIVICASIANALLDMNRNNEIRTAALRGNIAMLKAREYEAEFLNRHDDKWIPRVEKSIQEVNQSLDLIDRLNHNARITEHSKRARELAKQYLDQFVKLAETARRANFDNATVTEGLEELRDVLNDFEPQLDTYIPKIAGDLAQTASARLDMTIYKAKRFMLAVLITSVVLQLAMLLLMTAPVLKSLAAMRERLRDIASGEGDLTKRLEVHGRDEIGETASCFNTFIDKLNAIIAQVASRSGELGVQSGSLSATADQMSRGVEEVSARTAGLATASEEMDATSQDIARNCHLAAENAEAVNKAAVNGSAVLGGTIDVMKQMSENVGLTASRIDTLGVRADQVGNIVTTIEDIADQTNLLALNAAIEAARAGETGRGFAVVADEVRALAERTSRATREINEMIRGMQKETKDAVGAMKSSISDVAVAVESARESGVVLGDIRNRVEELSEQLGQIATAAEQQNATTQEISSSIQNASVTLDQTASTVRGTGAAVHELDRVAEELNRLVGSFRLS